MIIDEIDIKPDTIKFHTNSKVVLNYIYNQTRRFYVHVNNRVTCIRRSTRPEQWHYVPTDHNPADHATRSVPAALLLHMMWPTGPDFLSCLDDRQPGHADSFQLLNDGSDLEICPR